MELKYFSQSNQTLLQNICVHIPVPQTIDIHDERDLYWPYEYDCPQQDFLSDFDPPESWRMDDLIVFQIV